VPVSVVDVAFVNNTVSPVSSVTVIDAPSATSSLTVAVIFIAVPTPYDPLAVVEENEVTVGLVVSIVTNSAVVDAESIPEVVCFAVTDQTPSASVPRAQLDCAVAVNEHVTEVEPAFVAVTVTVLRFVALPTEIVGVLSDVMLSFSKPEFEPESKTGLDGVEGVAIYVNPGLSVADCVSVLVTTMFCAPAVPAGVVQVIDVDDTMVTLVQATPPTVTVAPDKKFVPVIVIAVPPAAVPEVGETLDTLGAAANGVTLTDDEALEVPAELIAFR
jgi:hypothetical protein